MAFCLRTDVCGKIQRHLWELFIFAVIVGLVPVGMAGDNFRSSLVLFIAEYIPVQF
jgi:hypothetical protein